MNTKKNEAKSFGLYLIVGGIATLVEWIIFYLLNGVLLWNHLVATIIAYLISTFANWAAGRLLVFKEAKIGFIKEITSIYVASLIGLAMNLLIMWIMVDCISLNEMLSMVTATVIVFMYNYLIRKLVIYRKDRE